MTLATNFQATAYYLLNRYGQTVTCVRDNIGAYDVSTGTVTDTSDTNFSGVGYPRNYKQENIDNEIIRQSDVELLLYSTTEPKVNDILTINSKAYTALDVKKITCVSSNIYYIVQLRQ